MSGPISFMKHFSGSRESYNGNTSKKTTHAEAARQITEIVEKHREDPEICNSLCEQARKIYFRQYHDNPFAKKSKPSILDDKKV